MAFEIYDSTRHHTQPVLGVLFDMDGLVLDTEKLYARFWREAAHSLGFPMTWEQALGMRSLNQTAGQEQLNRYFGPGASYPEFRARRIEGMDAYIALHGCLTTWMHSTFPPPLPALPPWTGFALTWNPWAYTTGSPKFAAATKCPGASPLRISTSTALPSWVFPRKTAWLWRIPPQAFSRPTVPDAYR